MKEKDFKGEQVEGVEGLVGRSWMWEIMGDYKGEVFACPARSSVWCFFGGLLN